jgi:hypothetical protein
MVYIHSSPVKESIRYLLQEICRSANKRLAFEIEIRLINAALDQSCAFNSSETTTIAIYLAFD